ncbi:MAG: S1 RNA-binding domain-containing protein [Bdellovibrionota bacterium]
MSHLSHEFVDDPRKVVSPGDKVKVKVLGVDEAKNQISLTMLLTEKPKTKVSGTRSNNNRPAGKSAGARKPGGNKAGARKPQNKRPPREPMNNAFAVLADFKNTLKK